MKSSNFATLLVVCISLIYTQLVSAAPRDCEQYPTLAQALAAEPDLQKIAIPISTDAKAITILNSPLASLTMLVPVDSAPTADNGAEPVSPLIEGLVGHYSTMIGDYSVQNVTSVPSINTNLGFITLTDIYAMKFYNNQTTGKLYVQGLPQYPPSEVVGVIEACNGMIYKLADTLVLANTTKIDFLEQPEIKVLTPATIDERLMEASSGKFNEYACDPAVFVKRGVPFAQEWLDIWNATGLLSRLSDPMSAFTVFLPPPRTIDLTNSTLTTTLLYNNMLPGLWCADELLSAGKKVNMLDSIQNIDVPLVFTNDSNGNLIVTGANGAATVQKQHVWCNSIFYQTDEALLPPDPNANVSLPNLLPTLPVRHINCSAEYQVNIATYSDGGSDDTALIVGLSVGLVCAALLAAALYVVWNKKRKNRQPPTKKIYPGDGGGGLPDVEDNRSESPVFAESELAIKSNGSSIPVIAALGWLNTAEHHSARVVVDHEQEAPISTWVATTDSEKTVQVASQLSRLASFNSPNRGDMGIDMWSIDPADVTIDVDMYGQPTRLGTGGFGVAYRGMLRGVQPAAMKVLRGNQESEFLKEVAILKHVNRDRNVVQLYGSCRLSEDQLLIVMELMEGGDLRKNLDSPNAADTMAWTKNGKRIALDVARGLTALHANNIVHRDLKSKNILLTRTLEAKIADVGLAAVHSQGFLSSGAGQVIGTLAWAAPEVLLGQKCNEKVDIYSFGIVLYEIVTRHVPRRGMLELPNPCEECPAELIALIFDCLKAQEIRPSAKEVCDRLLKIPPLVYPDV